MAPIPANKVIALCDGLERCVMDATALLANEVWLEKHLKAMEALATNGDDVSIRKLLSLLLVGYLRCLLHLGVKIQKQCREASP